MDLRKLKKLIDLVQESGVQELEVKEGEESVRITRTVAAQQTVFLPQGPMQMAPAAPAAPARASLPATPEAPPEIEGHIVKSPMVGTFYRSSTPGGKVFVDIGESVSSGDVLCIIEAMKLMNEIHAEVKGTIVACLAENGKPIEFGQPLFKVKVG